MINNASFIVDDLGRAALFTAQLNTSPNAMMRPATIGNTEQSRRSLRQSAGNVVAIRIPPE